MSKTRFATVIGLAIGGLWGLAGLSGALLAGLGALTGFLVALAMEGRIDLSEIRDRVQKTARRRPEAAARSPERRTRWPRP